MIKIIEIKIIRLIIKFYRLFCLNYRLSINQKKKYEEILIKKGFKLNNFFWKSQAHNFRIFSCLANREYGYYFIFNIKIFPDEYFPKWPVLENSNVKEDEDKDFIIWLLSIKRIFERAENINISIKDGAKIRKKFNFFSDAINKK